MDKNKTQKNLHNIPDETVVISPARLPPRPSATGKKAAGDKLTSGNIIQAFSDIFFTRRALPDDLINIITDDLPEVPRAEASGLNQTLMDVKSAYQIKDDRIASGGQGFINRASDRALGCTVALKTLHDKFKDDPEARQSFINEARITAELDHPAIIPIHGLFSDQNNGLHLAMKLIYGYTLDKFLQRIIAIYNSNGIKRYNERKSLRNRIDILLRVCDAISYAHHRSIIHRDLKPSNIMIGRYRETYVTDWGIAAHLNDTEHLEKISGTPGYIAPEVLTSQKADVRSDVYSLGVILFEITTLSPAFADDELPVLLQKVQMGMHLPLKHRFKFRIDRDLAAIINKAIAVNPADRYQTVGDLARDLRKYLAHDAVSARKEYFWHKLARWGINHRRGMLITTLSALLLSAGSIAYTLNKEFRSSVTQRWLDNTASAVYVNTVDIANNVENRIGNIEHKLEKLQMHIQADELLKKPAAPDKTLFYPVSKLHSAPPESFVYSPVYKHNIDTENIFVINTEGSPKDPLANVYHLTTTAEYMRQCLLEMLPDNSGPEGLLTTRNPAQMIYLALADGTFACYPGIDKFTSNYPPRKRSWYKKAIENPGIPQWSTPYKDAFGNRGQVTTCAIAVKSLDGNIIGVAAMDFSLARFGSELLGSSGKYGEFVCEKMLINRQGNVLLRLSNPVRKNPPQFNDAEIIKRMTQMRYGTLTVPGQPHEHLLAFAEIKSLGLIYVECIDLHLVADAIEKELKSPDGIKNLR